MTDPAAAPIRIPFFVAGAMALGGLALVGAGLAMLQDGGDMNGFGLVTIGGFLLVMAVVTAAVYGKMERQRRDALGEPLLSYRLPPDIRRDAAEKAAAEIRGQNLSVLLVMLAFCVLLALVGPFLAEDGWLFSVIALGLGAFLALAALVITRYRTWKLRRGGDRVVVARKGALVHGQFHAWTLLGARIDAIGYRPGPRDDAFGELAIAYSAPSRTGRQSVSLAIPVPADQEEAARRTVEVLREGHRLS